MNGDDWRRRYAPQIQAELDRADRAIAASRRKLILVVILLIACVLAANVLGGVPWS